MSMKNRGRHRKCTGNGHCGLQETFRLYRFDPNCECPVPPPGAAAALREPERHFRGRLGCPGRRTCAFSEAPVSDLAPVGLPWVGSAVAPGVPSGPEGTAPRPHTAKPAEAERAALRMGLHVGHGVKSMHLKSCHKPQRAGVRRNEHTSLRSKEGDLVHRALVAEVRLGGHLGALLVPRAVGLVHAPEERHRLGRRQRRLLRRQPGCFLALRRLSGGGVQQVRCAL